MPTRPGGGAGSPKAVGRKPSAKKKVGSKGGAGKRPAAAKKKAGTSWSTKHANGGQSGTVNGISVRVRPMKSGRGYFSSANGKPVSRARTLGEAKWQAEQTARSIARDRKKK